MSFSFQATTTSADADGEVVTCGFSGTGGWELGVMNDTDGWVRLAWCDGTDGEDEAVVELLQVELSEDRVRLQLGPDRRHSRIPYQRLEVRYENVDDRFLDLIDIFERLCAAHPERLMVDR